MIRIARAVLAVTIMAGLLVGVPGLLLQIDLAGTVNEFSSNPADFLRQPLGDSALLAILALIGWSCWLATCLAFMVETWGVFRGRPIRHLRGLGFPQRSARVIAGWLFVGGAAIPSVPALQALVPPESVVVDFAHIAAIAPVDAEKYVGDEAQSATEDTRTHIVVEDDNLWELAEHYLGDGFRWRELFALNEGVEQPDGKCLVDPNLILLDWRLELPLDSNHVAVGVVVHEPADPEIAPGPPASISAHDSLSPSVSSSADEQPLVRLQQSEQTDPELMWIEPIEVDNGVSESSSASLVLSAGSVLAAGALIEAERRRRTRRRSYSKNLGPTPLDDRLSNLKSQIVSQAVQLPSGVGRFWNSLRSRGVPVAAARITNQEISLLIGSDSLLPPWSKDEDGWWKISRAGVMDDSEEVWPPLLVSVTESPALVLVDLKEARVLNIIGSGEALDNLIEAVLFQLRCAGPGPSTEFVVVGEFRGVGVPADRTAVNLGAMTIELEARSGSSEDALVVVVSAEDPDLDRAQTLALEGGLVLIVLGELSNACELTMSVFEGSVQFSSALIPPSVIESNGFSLSNEEVMAIRELLAYYETSRLCAETPMGPAGLPPFHEGGEDTICLRLLGDVSVGGLRASLPPQQLAILVYVYLHPGATRESIQDAVWAGVKPSLQRFKNVISSMRSVLGYEHFPLAEGGRYQLGPHISSDIGQFESLTAEGSGASDANLSEALDLVTGVPVSLGGALVRHLGWADIENLGSYWELRVLRVAILLTERYLEAQEFDLAIAAARQGLRGCPLNEQLTRLMITAHLGAGQQRIAGEVANELIRALEELGVDELEAETEMLVASIGVSALHS